MKKHSAVVCLVFFLWCFVGGPAATMAQVPPVPVPERASTFLDPVEALLRSAPASALQKLKSEATAAEGAADLNRYFREYAVDKSIVLHTKVEAAEPIINGRNGYRIRAASVPLKWDGGTMKRHSWLYFLEAQTAAANSVKAGAEITVVGWVRKCQVDIVKDGPCFFFDIQHARIVSSSMPVMNPNASANEREEVVDVTPKNADALRRSFAPLAMAGTWVWDGSEKIYPGTIDFENDGTGSHGARNNMTWKMTGKIEITITHATRGTAVIYVDEVGETFVGTDYQGKAVTGKRLRR
jgi:hypothetical protein